MATTPCPGEGTLLAAALGEEVDPAVRAHLDACPECGRRVARLRAEVRAVRDVPLTGTGLGASDPLASALSGDGGGAASPGPMPAAIGKYPVVGRLGTGGQGEVFRAVHPDLRLDLVIKLAHRPLDRVGLDHDHLAAEGRLLAGLDHPNLLRVYDLGVHEGRLFLALEYVRGCTLGQLAGERGLEPRRAAALVAELARTVAYLDGRGVVHQDLKPANILVDEAGRPRLIDFGLARLRDAWCGDVEGPSGGTLAFMAPEQARGELDRVGPRSDVFALGAVLYFLLTGRPPYEGRDAAEMLARAGRGEFDRDAVRRRGVPRRLGRAVLRAMALEPEGRHATAGALADELENIFRRRRRVAAALHALPVLAALTVLTGWGVTLMLKHHFNMTIEPRLDGRRKEERFAPREDDPPLARPIELAPPTPSAGVSNIAASDPAHRRFPLKGTIDLVVYEAATPGATKFIQGNRERFGLRLHEPGALPLGPRDWVRIEAKVDRPAYLYVVWFDTDGKATPLWPWRGMDRTQPPEAEVLRDRLTLPDSESGLEGMPLSGGAPGAEGLLLLTRDAPLGPVEYASLMRALAQPRPRPAMARDQAKFAVWLENGERVIDEPTRAPLLEKAGVIGDPEIQIRNLMKELRPLFPYSRAVCFGNRGDR